MKDYFVTRNADRMGVVVGVVIAAMGWFVAAVLPHNGLAGRELVGVVAICGMLGFSLSKIVSYSFPLDDPEQEKTARRLYAFYMGAWLGCYMATAMGVREGMARFAIIAIIQLVIFGGAMFVISGWRRYSFDTSGFGYDLENPAEVTGRVLWFPFAMIVAVTAIAIGFEKPILVSFIWAGFMVEIPELHPRLDTGIWRRVGQGWVVLSFGAFLSAMLFL